ncbi:TonB family protein [bacterium]|nr:TonB family protein [bacterium]
MTAAFQDIRESIEAWIQDYLSVEENRRDARSAAASMLMFVGLLFFIARGNIVSYMLIENPGRTLTVRFSPAPQPQVAELAQTRIQQSRAAPRAVEVPPPPESERPPRLQSLASMAAARPDYFGKHPILPPQPADRPVVSDAPARWREKPTPQEAKSERRAFGSASVDMPEAKIGTPTGTADPSASEVSFDVQVTPGTDGKDFITLSGRAVPSSVGRPGGKEMSSRRPILKSPLPTVPEWFERKGLDSFVTLRIVISASGKVESAEVEKTSGFKEMDGEAREKILQWVFQPTGFRESMVVKINYRLR